MSSQVAQRAKVDMLRSKGWKLAVAPRETLTDSEKTGDDVEKKTEDLESSNRRKTGDLEVIERQLGHQLSKTIGVGGNCRYGYPQAALMDVKDKVQRSH